MPNMAGIELIQSGVHECELNLVAAILTVAKNDWIDAYTSRNHGRCREVESFIYGKTFEKLCDVDPDVFMHCLKKSI